jgi:hypothetical protein
MKMFFSSLVLAMLCCVTHLCKAQDSLHIDKLKTKSTHPSNVRRLFDINEDLKLMNLLTSALEKDGLIDTLKPYKLEIRDGEFYIGGKKQSKEVRDKYRMYFRKDSTDHYTIQSDGNKSTLPSNDEVIKEKGKGG